MFFSPTAAFPALLSNWIQEIMDHLTFAGSDRPAVDQISATEIIDLAYLEGSPLDDAIAAHALYPAAPDGGTTGTGNYPSQMAVEFDIDLSELGANDEPPALEVTAQWGRPSLVGVGAAGVFPRSSLDLPPGDQLHLFLFPRISDSTYSLRDPGGGRLRSLAGPLDGHMLSRTFTLSGVEGTINENYSRLQTRATYAAYGSSIGFVATTDPSTGILQPLNPTQLAAYNRNQYATVELRRASTNAVLTCSWQRRPEGRITVSMALANASDVGSSHGRELAGAALVLPHVYIRVSRGAHPVFPLQQIAAVRRQMASVSSPAVLQSLAEQRLYAVRQSGCIATQSQVDDQTVVLSTFGVIDFPRDNPLAGPAIESLLQGPNAFLALVPEADESLQAFVTSHWDTLRAILVSAGTAFGIEVFHQFQWEAIATNLSLLSRGQARVVTIVRAPTGAGKTVVFMVNAAVSSLLGSQRRTSVLLFPTRLLNEDMFRRLTAFVSKMREQPILVDVTGGILMGTGDPLSNALNNPSPGEPMYHAGPCPQCGAAPLVAWQVADRLLPGCNACGHQVDYMFTPREVPQFLPDVLIATPDKLFYDTTYRGWEQSYQGLLGAPVRRCSQCNRAYSSDWLELRDKSQCEDAYPFIHCPGRFGADSQTKPIGYMGFDEVHSLYGPTATYLSVFLTLLWVIQSQYASANLPLRFETATATISNETELLEALTRRRATNGEIVAIPSDNELLANFPPSADTIRYRTLVTMPVRVSTRLAFIRATLNAFRHIRAHGDLAEALTSIQADPKSWEFLLGYVFRKQDGLDLRRALRDFYLNVFNQNLRIDFLSGESPKAEISHILQRALAGDLDILLANLVISLGMDIHGLNHMIMYGVPNGFTELVQTAGRTGRGESPGHVHIVLQPNGARDAYVYRHFHAVLGDVAGYYDILPVRSSNLHCSSEIFGNVVKSVITARLLRSRRWGNRQGVMATINAIGREAFTTGIRRILCDDQTLAAATHELVSDRMQSFMDMVTNMSGFLFDQMEARNMLTRGLRGRTGAGARLVCSDELLLNLIESSSSFQEAD